MRALTPRQYRTLEILKELARKYPDNNFGFNPQRTFSGAVALQLEKRGLVTVDRVSPGHFRYMAK